MIWPRAVVASRSGSHRIHMEKGQQDWSWPSMGTTPVGPGETAQGILLHSHAPEGHQLDPPCAGQPMTALSRVCSENHVMVNL